MQNRRLLLGLRTHPKVPEGDFGSAHLGRCWPESRLGRGLTRLWDPVEMADPG